MEVSYATMIAVGTLVQRLGRDASRYQAALAEAVNEAAEWKRIADELKAERNALRSTAGHLLDAFGSLANEPRHGATDDEYRDRIVTKIHTIKLERDALRAECDDLRRVFALVHGSLGIQQGEHIGNAIEALKKERDGLMIQVQDMRAEIDRLKKPARKHPVAVGEYVKRLTGFNTTPAGEIGRVTQVDDDASEIEYEVTRPNGQRGVWCAKNCTPCEPPTAATHDTPEGKQVAESAVKREPKPGDTVRLVRVPTMEEYADWDDEFGGVGSLGVVKSLARQVANVKYNDFTWEWPISCIEIVEDAK